MKFFVLLHTQIIVTQSTIIRSVEMWTPEEVDEAKHHLKVSVGAAHRKSLITDYQRELLLTMIDTIEPGL